MDHTRAPILEAMLEFRRRGDIVYTPPGHKQGRGADPRVLEVLGREGLPLRRARDGRPGRPHLQPRLPAAGPGAHGGRRPRRHRLLLHLRQLAVGEDGDDLRRRPRREAAHRAEHPQERRLRAAARRHRTGLGQPVWDLELEIAHPPSLESVEAAWEAHPDAKGLLTLGPTDYGVAGPLRDVVQACHRRGKPIIIDEAWGAHLPFHEGLPTWGMDVDADVCVTSVHKAGSAFEQSSVFHLKGDRVDPAILKQREDLLATTSTSSLLYAALDGWRRQMVEQGHDLVDAALRARAGRARRHQRYRRAARLGRRRDARAPRRRRARSVPRARRGRGPGDHRLPGRRLAARRARHRPRAERPPPRRGPHHPRRRRLDRAAARRRARGSLAPPRGDREESRVSRSPAPSTWRSRR